MAMQHLKTDLEQGRVDLRQGAVWRSDEEERTVLHHSGFKRDFNHPHPDIEINTGGGNVIFNNTGEEVPVIPFDMLLWEATLQETRRVRCLKLDCERLRVANFADLKKTPSHRYDCRRVS